jgi:hypothetical protein
MGRVLGIVYWAISAHLIKKAGFTRKSAQTGVVTLIQRFGSPLTSMCTFMAHIPVRHSTGDLRSCKSAFLPICHMLFLDGVFSTTPWGKSRYHRTHAPTQKELTELVHTINHEAEQVLRQVDSLGLMMNLQFIAALPIFITHCPVNRAPAF